MREACDLIVKNISALMEAVRGAPTSTGGRR